MNPENGYIVTVWTVVETREVWHPQTVYEDTQKNTLVLTFANGVRRTYVLRNVVSYTVEARE